MTTFVTAWLMIFSSGMGTVTVPYPYSTEEACQAAATHLPGPQFVCIPVEVPAT